MQGATYIKLNKGLKEGVFAGGIIDNIEDIDKVANATSYAMNNRYDGESPSIRLGHQLFATLTSGSSPKGIGKYLRSNPTNNRIVVRHNTDATHKLYTIDSDGNATSIDTSTNIASNNRMRFVNVADVVYTLNGSDKYGKLDNTTYTIPSTTPKSLTLTSVSGKFTIGETVTGGTSGATGRVIGNPNNPIIIAPILGTFAVAETITGGTSSKTGVISVISNFTPSFGVPFDGKLVVSGWSSVANCILYGVADNYDDFVNSGADVGSVIEQCTGLASTNQALFYFTPNTISVTDHGDIVNTNGTVSYNSSYLQTKEGAVNHDSIIVVGQKVYYVSPSNTISMIVRGSNVNGFDTIGLSDRKGRGISTFLSSIPKNQTNCRAYLQEDTNLIHWFFYSQDSAYPDKVVVYDHVKDIFVSFDTNRFFYGGIYFEKKNYTISAIESKVFIDDYGYDDQGQSIAREYRTKLQYLGGGLQDAQLRESRTLLDMNTLSNPTQEIWLNGQLADTTSLDEDNLSSAFGGLGTESIGTFAVGTEGSDGVSFIDYQSIRLLRSKGLFLYNKFNTIQRRWKNQTIGGKVRIKDVSPLVSGVTPMRTPQN